MSKNLIPQIAEMLSVELGEEFKIKGYELTYMITDDKGLMATNDSPETGWTPANALFTALLNGKDEIVKLPWKPKEGEFYYSFGIFAQTWGVSKICWLQHPFDFALLEKGWVYRTRAEAKTALPAVAKEMGVEFIV